MKKMNYKIGLIIGATLVIAAIIVALALNNDIAFLLSGFGIVVIGISMLAFINKK